MIIFENPSFNLERLTPENMRKLKSYLEEMTDRLNLLAERLELLEKERKE